MWGEGKKGGWVTGLDKKIKIFQKDKAKKSTVSTGVTTLLFSLPITPTTGGNRLPPG